MSLKEQRTDSHGGCKLPYQAPEAHRVTLTKGLSLLESFSAEAEFEEFGDGGEL